MGKEEITYELTDDPKILEGIVLGKTFKKQVTVFPNGSVCRQVRRVEIALVRNGATGDLEAVRYQPGEHPPIDDFPTLKLKKAMLLRDQMWTGDIATVRKAREGASRQFVDVDPRRHDRRLKISKPRHSLALIP